MKRSENLLASGLLLNAILDYSNTTVPKSRVPRSEGRGPRYNGITLELEVYKKTVLSV